MKICLFLLILMSVPLAFAAKETFDLGEGKKVSLNVPNTWQAVKDLYGTPVMLLGPMGDHGRPAATLLRTFVTPKKISKEEFESVFTDFKNEKVEWLKKHQGQLISFEPMTKVDFSKDLYGHYIGAEFNINSIHYIERSYYLYCGGEVVNYKYSTLRRT